MIEYNNEKNITEETSDGSDRGCDHCEETFPIDELTPCAVEPDFHFCEDCVDKLRDF